MRCGCDQTIAPLANATTLEVTMKWKSNPRLRIQPNWSDAGAARAMGAVDIERPWHRGNVQGSRPRDPSWIATEAEILPLKPRSKNRDLPSWHRISIRQPGTTNRSCDLFRMEGVVWSKKRVSCGDADLRKYTLGPHAIRQVAGIQVPRRNCPMMLQLYDRSRCHSAFAGADAASRCKVR